jgi:hypothetical protein
VKHFSGALLLGRLEGLLGGKVLTWTNTLA